MARTIFIKGVFIENRQHPILRRVLETRINNSQLDRKVILEKPQNSSHVKAQGLNFRILHNKVPSDFNENGTINPQQGPKALVPLQ